MKVSRGIPKLLNKKRYLKVRIEESLGLELDKPCQFIVEKQGLRFQFKSSLKKK